MSLPRIQFAGALERAEAFLHVDNEAVRGDGGADLRQGTRPGGGREGGEGEGGGEGGGRGRRECGEAVWN